MLYLTLSFWLGIAPAFKEQNKTIFRLNRALNHSAINPGQTVKFEYYHLISMRIKQNQTNESA